MTSYTFCWPPLLADYQIRFSLLDIVHIKWNNHGVQTHRITHCYSMSFIVNKNGFKGENLYCQSHEGKQSRHVPNRKKTNCSASNSSLAITNTKRYLETINYTFFFFQFKSICLFLLNGCHWQRPVEESFHWTCIL